MLREASNGWQEREKNLREFQDRKNHVTVENREKTWPARRQG